MRKRRRKRKAKAPRESIIPAGDGLLNLDEAAAWLGISRVTLRIWSSKGKVAFVQLGRRKLFHREALAEFAAQHTVPTGPR